MFTPVDSELEKQRNSETEKQLSATLDLQLIQEREEHFSNFI
jgi:hypothetical protein